MFPRAAAALSILLLWPALAHGDGDATALVSAGSEVRYQVVRVPSPAGRLAKEALDSIDGIAAAAPPPADLRWIADGLSEPKSGQMPLGAQDDRGRCGGCKTVVGDARLERIAAIRAETEFKVRGVPEVLEIRARRFDGLSVWINGREVVRRNLSQDLKWAGSVAGEPLPAASLRGPEWETFRVSPPPGLLRTGTNRLAAESRPSAQRDDVGLDLEVRAAPAGRLVRGPMIQQVGEGRAMVLFDSDVPTVASVEYRDSTGAKREVRSARGGLSRHHRVWIDGLPVGQLVPYSVQVGTTRTTELRFPTPPSASEPLRFVVYGDMRGGHATHARLIESIRSESPDLVLLTGDLVVRGSDEGDWQRFFEVAAPLLATIPFYPAAGNHDVGRAGDERRRMNEIFGLWPGPKERPNWGHWHSFDVAGVHFVMLDSNAYESAEQHSWLESDLAAARKRGVRAIFALTHNGPYSRGSHRGSEIAAAHYVPILVRYGVDYLFAGHDHLYQRGKAGGIRYIVSGGGGAPLYAVRCGGAGRPRCAVDDGMEFVTSAHHYVLATIQGKKLTLCPKRPDGSALEGCTTVPLSGRP